MRNRLYCLLLIVLPLMASAVETVVDGIKYTLDETTLTAEAAGLVNSNIRQLVIPASINVEGKDYQVLSIGDEAFRNNYFTAVSLPEGLVSIGDAAFMVSHTIRELFIPNSVETIGQESFRYLPSLKTVVLGEGLKIIGKDAFYLTKELKELYIYAPTLVITTESSEQANWSEVKLYVPADLVEEYRKTELPYWSNVKDENIISLDSPDVTPPVVPSGYKVVDGIKYLLYESIMTAEAAGLADSTITDLVIPASIKVEEKEYQVVSVGYNAFNDNHFSSITLSEGLKSIDRVAFMFSWKVKKIILPNSVESVGVGAFEHSSVKTLVFGKGIKTIKSFAICSLPDLKELYIYAQQMPEIAPWESDFPDESHWYDVKLYVPEELVEDYRQYKSTLPNFDEIKDANILPITKDYESFLSSINAIDSDPGNAVYYSLDGCRLKSPQKGINIIRQSDGTTKKILVK